MRPRRLHQHHRADDVHIEGLEPVRARRAATVASLVGALLTEIILVWRVNFMFAPSHALGNEITQAGWGLSFARSLWAHSGFIGLVYLPPIQRSLAMDAGTSTATDI
jgi:hypothetical protein